MLGMIGCVLTPDSDRDWLPHERRAVNLLMYLFRRWDETPEGGHKAGYADRAKAYAALLKVGWESWEKREKKVAKRCGYQTVELFRLAMTAEREENTRRWQQGYGPVGEALALNLVVDLELENTLKRALQEEPHSSRARWMTKYYLGVR